MNALKLIGAIFLLGSILLLGAGGYAYHHTKKFLANSVVAKGTVVDLAPRSSRSGGPTYAPVVRFKTERGETITVYGSLASSPPSYKRGEEVKVRYDPKNPRDISIDSFFELWLLTLVLLGIGTVFGMVGAPMVLVSVFSDHDRISIGRRESIRTKWRPASLSDRIPVAGSHHQQSLCVPQPQPLFQP